MTETTPADGLEASASPRYPQGGVGAQKAGAGSFPDAGNPNNPHNREWFVSWTIHKFESIFVERLPQGGQAFPASDFYQQRPFSSVQLALAGCILNNSPQAILLFSTKSFRSLWSTI